MKLTLNDFLNTVKVLRMLYGVKLATEFFEKNFEEFTGQSIKDLDSLKAYANITAPRDKNKKG